MSLLWVFNVETSRYWRGGHVWGLCLCSSRSQFLPTESTITLPQAYLWCWKRTNIFVMIVTLYSYYLCCCYKCVFIKVVHHSRFYYLYKCQLYIQRNVSFLMFFIRCFPESVRVSCVCFHCSRKHHITNSH